MITIEDFGKLEIRIGEITSAEKVEGADKLLKLLFNFGSEIGTRQIIAGIAAAYPDPSALVGKKCAALVNIVPRILRGLESQGMILAADLHPLTPLGDIPVGMKVK